MRSIGKETWRETGGSTLHYSPVSFARVNEEVSHGSAWSELVHEYARVATASSDYDTRTSALVALRKKWLADPDRGELAEDIERHFWKPTRQKAFADLERIYEKSPDLDTRARALWAMIDAGFSANATALAANLLRDETPEELLSGALHILTEAKDRRAFDFASRRIFEPPPRAREYWWRQTGEAQWPKMARETKRGVSLSGQLRVSPG